MVFLALVLNVAAFSYMVYNLPDKNIEVSSGKLERTVRNSFELVSDQEAVDTFSEENVSIGLFEEEIPVSGKNGVLELFRINEAEDFQTIVRYVGVQEFKNESNPGVAFVGSGYIDLNLNRKLDSTEVSYGKQRFVVQKGTSFFYFQKYNN
jgi:hypothetical protein